MFKRKKQEQNQREAKFTVGSYSHLRKQSYRRRLQFPQISFHRMTPKRYRFRRSSLFFVPLLLTIPFIFYFTFFSNTFAIQHLEIIGELTVEQKEYISEQLTGKNMIRTSVESINRSVHNTSVFIESVFTRKIYPNTIEIRVETISPEFLYVDFSRYALFDQKNQIIDSAKYETSVSFSEEQQEWIEGNLNIDSTYVQETYLKTLPENEIATFDWKSVPLEEKESIIQLVADSVNTSTETFLKEQTEVIQTEFGIYPVIKNYQETDDSFLKQNQDIITNIATLRKNMREVLPDEVTIESIHIRTFLKVEVFLSDQKIIFFSVLYANELSNQLERLHAVVESGVYSDYAIIDVRTEKFTGRN